MTVEPSPDKFFETEVSLPDAYFDLAGDRMVGFVNRYERVAADLRLLLDKGGLKEWSDRFYGSTLQLVESLGDRYPLLIFHGDVGTGKTETAQSAASRFVRDLKVEGRLYKLSTRVRGTGAVGQMSFLINQAFNAVTEEAGKQRYGFLIIDEADSLAGTRNAEQTHHEDKVAVNTLIQHIDDIRRLQGRVVVILCTNRFEALDPAIVRRAARIEAFQRPSVTEREQLLRSDCAGLDLSDSVIRQLVQLTGPENGNPGFTFADIRTRLLPTALGKAFPNRKLTGDDFLEAAQELNPSPSMVSDQA